MREDDGRWSEGLGGGVTGGMDWVCKGRYLKGVECSSRGSQLLPGAPVGLIKHLRCRGLYQGYVNPRQVANASPWGGSSSKAAWVSRGIICRAP